jgi:zinc protease
MNRIIQPLLLIVFLLFAYTQPGFAQKHYKELDYPALGDIQIPDIEQFTLPNGMRVYLCEDRELPMINVSAFIRTGSVFDPPEIVGLSSAAGTLMRTGGTRNMTGDEIDELLERIAANVDVGIGTTSGSASVSVLTDHFDTALHVFADILMHPVFAQDKIELQKIRYRDGISRRNDDPGNIASREFRRLLYGRDSAYGAIMEYAHVDAMTQDKFLDFHQQYFYPNNIMVGLCGDFNSEDMKKIIDDVFGGWEQKNTKSVVIPEVEYTFDASVNLITKDDMNQAHIMMGHIGGTRKNPDYPALVIMNRILSGSFNSRMIKTIRTQMGLAYSVWGIYSFQYDYPGYFYAGCQTKSESAIKALKAIQHEIEKIKTELVTDEELQQAIDMHLNSDVFNYDSKQKILDRVMTYDFYGYPEDFLRTAKQKIENVTKQDILDAAKRNLQPDKMRILVLGNPEQFDEELSTLGNVHKIDITIPTSDKQ